MKQYQYDNNGNLTKKSVYLPGAVMEIAGGDTSYIHLDRLGSPAVVTDNSGNVKKKYRYYAFGELRSQSGAFSTDYSFTGYLKEETGAHYAKMRYYEGGIGRFLRPDPLGALNPYVYCGNDPLNFVDPEGMSKEIAGSMDTGERLEGEGNGFGESFGDWCSGGGPEQEDITNEYMDEIQEAVNEGPDLEALDQTARDIVGGAILSAAFDYIPGGKQIGTVIGLVITPKEIRGWAMVGSFTLVKGVGWSILAFKTGGMSLWILGPQTVGAFSATGISANQVYQYYKKQNKTSRGSGTW